MKKLYFLLAIMLFSCCCFAQTKNAWGPMQQLGCFKGIYFRVQRDHATPSLNKVYYNIEIHNRYAKKMGLTYFLFNPATEKPNDAPEGFALGDAQIKLDPGKIHSTFNIGVVGEGLPRLQIKDVCFVFDRDGQRACVAAPFKDKGSYAKCDNGVPNYVVYTAADQARYEAEADAAERRILDPNRVYKVETSPGLNAKPRSATDRMLDAYGSLLGVKSSAPSGARQPSAATALVVSRPAVAAPPTPAAPAAEVTERDFAMDVTPYNPLNAKEQAERFVAGFAKRPGVQTTPSGILYQALTAGSGPNPTATDKVKINFRRTTVVGKQYIAVLVNDKGESINMTEIGPAMAEGIRLMNPGSKFCFVFPAQLAGKQPDYPAGSVTLVWVIDLLEVVK